MNLCLISPLPPPYGGIANWTALIDEYVKNVEDVNIVHVNISSKKRVMDGRTLWDRVVVQGLEMFRHNKAMKNAIKKDKVDVIHMTTSGSLATFRDILMLKTAKKLAVPTVYHIRFGRVPEIAKKNTAEWQRLKKAMKLASCVMAIDSSTYDAILKYAPGVNVCYVPNPFDNSKLDGISVKEDEVRKEVVFVGWVIKKKGVEELLCAWETLSKKYPEWKLRIVGPAAEQYLESLKNNYPTENVIFDGEKSNKEALETVAHSSVFTLPSYTEGFPNAVLEAMALEKPIVATGVGAIPDMLDGCGIVVEPENADSLEKALDKMMSDEELRNDCGKKAKEKLLKEYTVEIIFDRYKQVWKQISDKS